MPILSSFISGYQTDTYFDGRYLLQMQTNIPKNDKHIAISVVFLAITQPKIKDNVDFFMLGPVLQLNNIDLELL